MGKSGKEEPCIVLEESQPENAQRASDDGVTMIGLSRRTSGIRLSDLLRNHNIFSSTTNAVVDSASSPPETLCAATVKVENEEDDVRIALAAPSHTPCSSDAASSQSIGTSDISIGDFSNSDFSCMDDDTKLKYMWTLVAKESSLNMSLNAVNEKLMKLRSEMVAVVNERNQVTLSTRVMLIGRTSFRGGGRKREEGKGDIIRWHTYV
uniref:Uncharacterized protein n=1 Tax=Ascaris lumbricoides TaxID=6252 RepID=A0A0M3HR14_ASCLU